VQTRPGSSPRPSAPKASRGSASFSRNTSIKFPYNNSFIN